MRGFQVFKWRGEVIPDIKAWAKERGEQMVVIEWTMRYPNIFSGQIVESKEIQEMPESFWNNLLIMPDQGFPVEIRRYDP